MAKSWCYMDIHSIWKLIYMYVLYLCYELVPIASG